MTILVATMEEYRLARERFPDEWVFLTGVGALNVISLLDILDRDTEILNFGYAGSNVLPIGTEVHIGECRLYHPNVSYEERAYKLKDGDVLCYTSSDFVTQTDIQEPVVFDMELAYIMALGFKNVKSIKIVSDNLSLKDYSETIQGGK